MGFRTTVITSLLSLLSTGIISAQPNKNGVPIVTNYEHSLTKGSEQNWCITQDHRGIIYVGNNNKGILEYDGVEWRRISVPRDPMIRSIVTGEDGVVYVGAVSEFGYLAPSRSGNMEYRSLSDDIDQEKYPFEVVWNTHYGNGKVYFCSFNMIFVYDPSDESLTQIETPENTFFSFLIDGSLYLSAWELGMMRYENDHFVLVPGGDFFIMKGITGLVKYDESNLLIGTYEHGLFLLDIRTGAIDEKFLNQELSEYFLRGNITHIQAIENHFVISSLNNGVVLLSREGEASEIITEKEDLIDEDATFVYYNDRLEKTSPLWITNYMGISKLETSNPFRVFNESSGFEDFVTDIKYFNGILYISTFNGLYYKSSSPTGTQFIPVKNTEGVEIRNLLVFKPSRNRKFLIASSEFRTYIIDSRNQVSILGELIRNPPDNMADQAEYAGLFAVQDPDDSEILYTGKSQIVGVRYHRGVWTEESRVNEFLKEQLTNKIIDKYGFLWTSSDNWVVRIDINEKNDPSKKFFQGANGLPSDENNRVFLDPDTKEVLIGTRDGFYRYNYFHDTIYRDTLHNLVLPPGKNLIMSFYQDHDKDYWYSFENESAGWSEVVAHEVDSGLQVKYDRIFQRLAKTSTDIIYSSGKNQVWFGKSDKLYHFNKAFVRIDSLPFHALIREVTLNTDSVLFYGTYDSEALQPQIKYSFNNVGFSWAAPFFEQEEEMTYSYKLEGFDEGWSAWEKTPFKEFTNLPHGSYRLLVKAQNVYGDESVPTSYSFTIQRPWYAHFLAYMAYLILGGIIVYLSIKIYTRRLKQENLRLEGIINERTTEIRKQKEEITDSIQYASRIQRALLPPEKLIDDHNIEHFILFKPRDIVSGDFYWMGSKNDRLLIVAADCTGHGVPGAFMSMLGMTFLDEIVIKSEVTNTNEILDQLREHVITSLRQSGNSDRDSTKDGMDLAMISIDIPNREFQFSGAYNPLYLVRKLKRNEKVKLNKGEELDLLRGSVHNSTHLLLQIRADQMPIGISEKTIPFKASSFKDEGYNIYMFSDGFLDQFGGPRGKKFMSKNFKKLILELQSIPLKDQGAAMDKVLTGWMGEISQIDDILVMGLRLNDN
jgi:serine phosphatase RsbU (regulator of sigma subunit)/outer membrane protein assembly factor BamB